MRSILDADPSVDDPVLVKVRALLAQAESTTFEAEAETFTAKAQELMARHAIDAAMLWATTSRDERPTTIRLPIDDPYADIKSLLLQYVASHSRCTAVWDGVNALSTVVGFASDVASTEMLFTSLLVQSQAALRAEGAKAGPGSRREEPQLPVVVPAVVRPAHRPAAGRDHRRGGAGGRGRGRGRHRASRCSPCWRPGTTPCRTP